MATCRPVGVVKRGRGALGQLGLLVPGQLVRQQHRHVEPFEIGTTDRMVQIRGEPLVQRCQQSCIAHVGPTGVGVPTAQERDAGSQPVGHRHVELAEARGSDPLEQRSDGRVARRRRPADIADGHVAQAGLGAVHQIVALLVPHDAVATIDLAGQRRLELGRIQAGTQPDASARSVAVQIGGDHELLARQGVVLAHPRAAAGAQLELADLAATRSPPGRDRPVRGRCRTGGRRPRRTPAEPGHAWRCRALDRAIARRLVDRHGRRACRR